MVSFVPWRYFGIARVTIIQRPRGSRTNSSMKGSNKLKKEFQHKVTTKMKKVVKHEVVSTVALKDDEEASVGRISSKGSKLKYRSKELPIEFIKNQGAQFQSAALKSVSSATWSRGFSSAIPPRTDISAIDASFISLTSLNGNFGGVTCKSRTTKNGTKPPPPASMDYTDGNE
jgi:hypothetical protein